MPVWLSQRGDKSSWRARAGIHAANCLLIPKAIISSCLLVYILTSLLKELWRIMCSHVSFLYCQNVSVGDQLGEHGWYTVQRCFFLSLFEAIWGPNSWIWAGFLRMCVCVHVCVNALTCFASSGEWPHPPAPLSLCWAVMMLMAVIQADHWDYVVSCFLFCFVFQHGQGVVHPLFMSTLVIQRKAI